MSVSQAYGLARFMYTLDDVLLGLRDRSDDDDSRSGVSLIEAERLSCLGISDSTFSRGVIFGLDLCQVENIASMTYGAPGAGAGGGIGGGLDPREWVVTRGALFDGTQLRNVEPTDELEFVYTLALPSGLRGANFIGIGAVLYETATGQFVTRMLGQSGYTGVIRTIEKTNVAVTDVLTAAFGENPQDDDLRVQPTATQIVIGRFVLDAELISDDVADYEIHASSARDRHPLPSGLPCASYSRFAKLLTDAMGTTSDPTFDSTLAYNLLGPVVEAAAWGGSFYDYWTTPGRSLPTNVKYYYNQLWDPDIP